MDINYNYTTGSQEERKRKSKMEFLLLGALIPCLEGKSGWALLRRIGSAGRLVASLPVYQPLPTAKNVRQCCQLGVNHPRSSTIQFHQEIYSSRISEVLRSTWTRAQRKTENSVYFYPAFLLHGVNVLRWAPPEKSLMQICRCQL